MKDSSPIRYFKYFFLLLGLSATTTLSAAEQLDIRLLPPTTSEHIRGLKSWRLYLSGVIGESDHIRVQRELERIPGNHFRVFLNSTGGNLFAGLELGRLFRSRGAWTSVGKEHNGDFPEIPLPGKCYSACTFAFLGGGYRFDGGDIGVHRAWKESINSTDFAHGQMITSQVAAFIRDMGVDIRLQELSMNKGRDEIYILSKSEKEELHVVNNGHGKAEWKLDIIEGSLALRAYQPSMYGDGQLIFSCAGLSNNTVVLYSFYQAGKTLASDIASNSWIHDLLLDGDEHSIDQPAAKFEYENEIRNIIGLSESDITALLHTKSSIGHSMKRSKDAPVFAGYTIYLDQDSRSMLHNYLEYCARRIPR